LPAELSQQQQQLCERIAVLRWVDARLELCSVRDATSSARVQEAMEAAGLCSLESLTDYRSIGLVLCSDGRGGSFFRSKGQALRLCAGGKRRIARPRWKMLPVWAAERNLIESASCASVGYGVEHDTLFRQSEADHSKCTSMECSHNADDLEHETHPSNSTKKQLGKNSSLECCTDDLLCAQQPAHSYFDVDTMQMHLAGYDRSTETCRPPACHDDSVQVPPLYVESCSSSRRCIISKKDAGLEVDQQAKHQDATSTCTVLHGSNCSTEATTALSTRSEISLIARPLARKRRASHSTGNRRSGMKSQRLPETETRRKRDGKQAARTKTEKACTAGGAACRRTEPKTPTQKVTVSCHKSAAAAAADANISASTLSEDARQDGSCIPSMTPLDVRADARMPHDTASGTVVSALEFRPSEESSPLQLESRTLQSSAASSALLESPRPDEYIPLWLRRIAIGY